MFGLYNIVEALDISCGAVVAHRANINNHSVPANDVYAERFAWPWMVQLQYDVNKHYIL